MAYRVISPCAGRTFVQRYVALIEPKERMNLINEACDNNPSILSKEVLLALARWETESKLKSHLKALLWNKITPIMNDGTD